VSCRDGGGRGRDRDTRASYAAPSSGFRRASICGDRAHLSDADIGLCRRAVRRPTATCSSSCISCSSAASGHDYDIDPTHAATKAAEAFAIKRGVCQTHHVFIAAARSLGIPARYVGGYFRRNGRRERAGCACLGRGLRAG